MQQRTEPHLDWAVLKIAQRCNLNCTYCYVYNRGDDSWQRRPPLISDEVITAFGRRVTEHCEKHSIPRFVVEFHGGEPLLVGKARMQRLLDILRAECPRIELKFLLQTNGVLLDEEWVSLFRFNAITVGISLDGPPELADRYRVFLDGKGSTVRVLENVRRLQRSNVGFEEIFGGILCVIHPDANGAELVRWFVAEGFHRFDFLLPDGHYANAPPGTGVVGSVRRFLLEAFDEWYGMGEGAPEIRLFETMMLGFMGITPQLDALGGDLRRLCVVESDGSVGISDVLRFCHPNYAVDHLDVFKDPLDARTEIYRIGELQEPCQQCRACPYFQSCGGGYLPHRFDGKSFANPSLYCEALYSLGERMASVIRRDVPPRLLVERSTEDASLHRVTP